MEFVEVDCPVCSENDYEVIFADNLGQNPPLFGYKWVPDIRKSYRTIRCNHCGHVYCSPRLEDMYEYYVDTYDSGYLKNSGLRAQTAKRVIRTIREYAPSGKLLDIGCATGDFLTVAREFYDVEGLELSDWAVDIATSKSLTIHKKLLKEMIGSGRSYDVITMWGVIEHLEFPKKEMQYINQLLNVGGSVCLWTGDVDSFYFKLFRQRWWYILGQHIQLFSRKSLKKLMHDTGFEPVYDGVYPYVISLQYLAISLSRYPVIGTLARNLFRWLGIEKRTITLKKSDEIFAIYRKVANST